MISGFSCLLYRSSKSLYRSHSVARSQVSLSRSVENIAHNIGSMISLGTIDGDIRVCIILSSVFYNVHGSCFLYFIYSSSFFCTNRECIALTMMISQLYGNLAIQHLLQKHACPIMWVLSVNVHALTACK